MSTTSPNYGFILPASTDLVSIGDINSNFSWIDTNLAATIDARLPSVDATPTVNSTNPVQSGGVATALALKLDKAATAYQGHDGEIFYINGYAQAVHKTFGAGDFALTGYTDPSSGTARFDPVAATDTINGAFQKVQGKINQLSANSGVTNAVKTALLDLLAHVAYVDDNGQDYYDALELALYPPVELVSITAVFTQGQAVIYDTDDLDVLRQYLEVTASYDDGTTATVTTYTLNGTLTVGTSNITASLDGKTSSFNVTVTQDTRVFVIKNGTIQQGYSFVQTANEMEGVEVAATEERPAYVYVHMLKANTASSVCINNITFSGHTSVVLVLQEINGYYGTAERHPTGYYPTFSIGSGDGSLNHNAFSARVFLNEASGYITQETFQINVGSLTDGSIKFRLYQGNVAGTNKTYFYIKDLYLL